MHACQNLYNSSALRDVSELVQLVCNYVTNGVLDVAVMVNEPTQQMRFYDEYRVIRFDDALPVLTISCSIVNLYQRNTHTHTHMYLYTIETGQSDESESTTISICIPLENDKNFI